MIKVLLLSPYPDLLTPVFEEKGDEVEIFNGNVNDPNFKTDCTHVVSFGYRTIIKSPFLKKYHKRIHNIHISALPWNRGADPNLWSILDATPAGVSIHEINEGVDTGLVAYQRLIFSKNILSETLFSTHDHLRSMAVEVFRDFWVLNKRTPDVSKHLNLKQDSSHRGRDKDPYFSKLPSGWDTRISDVITRFGKSKALPNSWVNKISEREFVIFSWELQRGENTLKHARELHDSDLIIEITDYFSCFVKGYHQLDNFESFLAEKYPNLFHVTLKKPPSNKQEVNLVTGNLKWPHG